MERNIDNLIASRNVLSARQRDLYISTIEKINMSNKELLTNDFGATLGKNIARDLAGEVVRRYFDLGDFYITADQLVERFLHFSYDNDQDFLMNNEEVRKSIYNATDSLNGQAMKDIVKNCQSFQSQLFTNDRANDKFDIRGKKDYRNSRVENIHDENGKRVGTLQDELLGKVIETTSKSQNKNDWYSKNLQADHKMPREAITHNSRYIKSSDEILDKYREFYNSDANMQMILASANGSKSDVRVCNVNGEIKYMTPRLGNKPNPDYNPKNDITMTATPEQLTQAAVYRWENAGESATEAMKKEGYLDKNGKVNPKVKEAYKKQMEEFIAARQNQLGDLEDFNYANIAVDAGKTTSKAVGKIIAGQLIYYVMPPIIFEAQQILHKKDITIQRFFSELKKTQKRIVGYVKDKMSEIMINIAGNSIHKFVKVFFDMVIEMAKTTVKKMLKWVKNIILSFVNCCKTVVNPKMSAVQKADSITKVMFTTINSIVLEILFEYLEKQFALPDILMEPLQIIVTIISTNLIMLALDELDLFNMRYGVLTSNIEKLFIEENEKFMEDSFAMMSKEYETSNETLKLIESDIADITDSIQMLNLMQDDPLDSLDNINKIFSMGIDFEDEWRYFTRKGEKATI